MTDEVANACQMCGSSVYQQHIDSGIARYEGGKLMCSHCLAEHEREHDADVAEDTAGFEAITLEDADEPAPHDMSQSKVMSSPSAALGTQGAWDDSRFKRRPDPSSPGAIRCRVFHTKLSEAAVQYMNNQVNEWLDENDQIVVKSSSTTIGVFEGKQKEPHLILTIFY